MYVYLKLTYSMYMPFVYINEDNCIGIDFVHNIYISECVVIIHKT